MAAENVNRWLKALLVVAVLLVAARAALPRVVEYFVNERLQSMEAYTGAVEDIDVAVVRGAYRIEGLRLDKRGGAVSEPLLIVKSIDLGLEWSALVHGEVVGDVHVLEPVIAFVDGPTDAEDQDGAGPDWAETLDALLPFDINSLEVENGTVSLYRTEEGAEPRQLLRLHGVTVTARNFTNVRESAEPVFATVALRGTVQEQGELNIAAELDPVSDPPVMTVDAELLDLPLTSLNPLLEAYANVDAEAGMVEIFAEFASREGRFEGYVKPLIRDADILRLDEEGSFFGKVWEGVVDAVKKIVENPETDRVGAQVPLSGELTAVDAELIPAVFSVLRNAFIEALSVGIGDVVGLEDIGLPGREADSPAEDEAD